MPCFHPLTAWRGSVQKSGKRSVVFSRDAAAKGLEPFELRLPCGQCIGCRLERSRQWAMRCVHEASLHKRNCFVTLTFESSRLPVDGSLDVRTFQLFMKRLRKHAKKCRVRFFHCGEYGDRFGRPHYHAILFNWDFADKYLWSVREGVRLYRSPTLERLWGLGFATVGAVTFESAAYVARYCMKKVNGERADLHYLDRRTGVIKRPEYVTMSRGGRDGAGGLGRGWYFKFKSDIYPQGLAVFRGKEVSPPKFYDGLFEVEDPDAFAKLKAERMARGKKLVRSWNDRLGKYQLIDDNGDDRLAVKEVCVEARTRTLVRPLEV